MSLWDCLDKRRSEDKMIQQQVTDPSRTLLTWYEFGNMIKNKLTSLKLKQITSPEQMRKELDFMLLEFQSLFEEFIHLMILRGILFAVENMNATLPQYHFASQWTPADDTMLKDLMEGVTMYLDKWTDDIQTAVAKEINVGIKQGESLEEIGTRVSDTLDVNANRGILIARTELMRAFNTAAKDRYEKAGFNMKWITARDPQVCDVCQPLDGQIVKTAPPKHPLCRCTIIPVLKE